MTAAPQDDRAAAPAEPVAWALTMPDGIRALHLSREASVAYSKGWPDAYAGCTHVPLYAHPAPPAPEPTRSQKLREAGYTRRPSWKSLPSDNMDDEPAPDAATSDQIMVLADEWCTEVVREGTYIGSQQGLADASAALRAAVERVVQDLQFAQKLATKNGDEVISERIRAERVEAKLAEARALLKEARLHVPLNYGFNAELLERIDALLGGEA